MPKINEKNDKLYWLYISGFFVILALPALNIPPWFTPPSYTQAIVFRSILAILGFVYLVKEKTLRLGSGQVNFKEIFNPRAKIFFPLFPILAYFVAVFISTLLSLDVSNSLWGTPARGAGFVNFAFLILLFFMSFIIVKGKDWKKLLDFSLIIGFIVGLIAIFQRFSILSPIIKGMTYRPTSTLGNTIILAVYLLPLIFLSLSFFTLEKNRFKKYSYAFLVVFYSFIIIFITQTRAALLGLLVGLLWFLIAYPKKMTAIKIGAVVLPIIFIVFIFFLGANTQIYENWPVFIKEPITRITGLTQGINVDQSRTSAWAISISAFWEKPYFGYGPENFYIAFNKHYDPNLPSMEIMQNFDRAHNYLIQTMVDSGGFALVFYLIFFFSLLWGLQKIKNEHPTAHGLQAGFIAFFIAGLASIEGFAIMLIFFFFSAYSFHLMSANSEKKLGNIETKENKLKFFKVPALIILFLVLIIFLWQYNFVPLQINSQVVIAQTLQNADWPTSSKILEEQSKIKTLLLPYVNSIYLSFLIDRVIYHPEEKDSISQTVNKISEENVRLQPYDYRNWLRLGESLATIAKTNKDPEIIKKSENAFNKALELSPKNPSIIFSSFMADVSLGNLKKAKEKADYCLKTFSKNRDCFWISALINIHLGDVKMGKEFIGKAENAGYDLNVDQIALRQLVAAYLETKNYKEMLPLYQRLSELDKSQVQYKTSVMLCYKGIGNYSAARQLALEVIKTNPELKPSIDEFLRTLYQ